MTDPTPLESTFPLFGPGSQPTEPDGAVLSYMSLPGAMRTYRPPVLPEPEDAAGLRPARLLLEWLAVLLGGYRVGALPQVVDLKGLDAANRRLVDETLGDGEVSIVRTGSRPARAQETRLAGVWRVQEGEPGVPPERDVLEIAAVPGFVRFGAFDGARTVIELPQTLAGAWPPGLMNAPGVIAELNAEVARRAAAAQSDASAGAGNGAAEPHLINLSLLPQTEQDLAFLAEQLGTGTVDILCRGYGNCRISSTRLCGVWWVRYFNSDDRMILSTLAVTDVPEAALAAQEDIDDSAARLNEILEVLG